MTVPTKELQHAWTVLQHGDIAAAVGLFGAIAERFPASAEAQAALGHAQLRAGREALASASLEQALRLSRRLPQAWRDLGLIAMQRSDFAAAEKAEREAVALEPRDANAWFLLGQALFALARHPDAEGAFARSAALHPSFVDARFRLGNLAFDKQAFAAAARHYQAFVRARPADLNGWINLGLSLASAADLAGARAAFESAVALAPEQVKPVALLATVMKQSGAAAAELAPVARRVLELSPETADMRVKVACCLFDEFDFSAAKASLARALELDPGNLAARWLQFQMPDHVVAPDEAVRERFLARWRDGIARFETIDWQQPEYAAQAADVVTAGANFFLAYLGRPLVDEQVRNARVLCRMAQAAWPRHDDVAVRPIGAKRRRVAVFSSSLHAHSVGRVWSPALLALDPVEFEVGVFHAGSGEDAGIQRWRARAAHFEGGERPADAWIEVLRAFAPDIVVFLDVGMDRFTQAVASLRHAPVQAATWAHPVTTGLETIDYFLSADACEPADGDAHYSETLVRLPRLGAFLDLPDPAPESPRGAAAEDSVRLLCAQSADKLHPAHDALFAGILAACPEARLDVLCGAPLPRVAEALAERLRPAFAAAGVAFDTRCRVHPRLPTAEYLAFVRGADVCLDSLDFSGGVTSLDALWQNRPIVTLPGPLMRGRQTFAMLKLIGLDDLVAADRDDYLNIAVRLARDATLRAAVSARIRRRKAELYGDRSVVDALAAFLRTVEAPARR